jgi:salicylate hydroxylase
MHTSNDTPSYTPLKVLVIGAGIAGLSTAIALGKQGHEVVV